MTPITTWHARLPCPSCGVVGLRTVAAARPCAAAAVGDKGPGRRLVSDCAACWGRRADAITAARRSLRATGELTNLGPGREDAWLGVPLRRCEADFEGAFASALLKVPGAEVLSLPTEVAAPDRRTTTQETPARELVEV